MSKIYLFNLKPINANTQHIRKARIFRDKIDEHWAKDDNGREYIDVKVYENAEPDKYGNTASAQLDTYFRDRKNG